jgi:hypothetical protein
VGTQEIGEDQGISVVFGVYGQRENMNCAIVKETLSIWWKIVILPKHWKFTPIF